MKISIFLPNYNLFLLISLTGFRIDETLKYKKYQYYQYFMNSFIHVKVGAR